jgi:hypothetical protein
MSDETIDLAKKLMASARRAARRGARGMLPTDSEVEAAAIGIALTCIHEACKTPNGAAAIMDAVCSVMVIDAYDAGIPEDMAFAALAAKFREAWGANVEDEMQTVGSA